MNVVALHTRGGLCCLHLVPVSIAMAELDDGVVSPFPRVSAYAMWKRLNIIDKLGDQLLVTIYSSMPERTLVFSSRGHLSIKKSVKFSWC